MAFFPSNRPAIFSFDNLSDDGRARVAVGEAIKKQKLLLPGGRFSYLFILNMFFIWSTFVGPEYLIAFRGWVEVNLAGL